MVALRHAVTSARVRRAGEIALRVLMVAMQISCRICVGVITLGALASSSMHRVGPHAHRTTAWYPPGTFYKSSHARSRPRR